MRIRRALVVLLICLTAPDLRADQAPPQALQAVRFDQQLGQNIPLGDSFVDDEGESVTLADYCQTRPVVLILAYYRCPMLCTMVLNGAVDGLGKVPLQPGTDFEVVVVSIDPAETPELARDKKERYLQQYNRAGAAGGWHFLTGPEASIQPLARAIGYGYAYDAPTQQFAHPAGLVLLTPAGVVSRYFFGVSFLPRDLRLGLVEASANKIGTRVDQLLLRCFTYDPLTGTYGLAVVRLLRVGGVATLAGLAVLISGLLWRERRKATQATGQGPGGRGGGSRPTS